MTTYRVFLLFWLLLAVFDQAFSFGGRLAPMKKVVKVYKEDEPDRKMAFIKFDNMSGIEDVEYLREDIPRALYSHFNNKDHTITVSTNELKPVWKQQAAYDEKVYPYYVEDATSSATAPLSGVETKTDSTASTPTDTSNNSSSAGGAAEQKKTEGFDSSKKYKENPQKLAEWMEENFKDGETFFFKRTEGDDQAKDKKVTFYMANKTNYYVDARNSDFDPKYLINDQKIKEFVIRDFDKETKTYEKVIFRESNRFLRRFRTVNQVMSIKNAKLDGIVSSLNEKNYDYALYGQIVQADVKSSTDEVVKSVLSGVLVKIFLVRAQSRQIELVYEKVINPFNIYNELSSIPAIVLASIQNKPMARDISFADNLGDSYIYLNDAFVGKTPLTLKSFPTGDYTLKIWNKDAELDYRSLLENKNLMVEQDDFGDEKRIYLKISETKNNPPIKFSLISNNSRGAMEVNVEGSESETKLYLDSKLTTVFQNKASLNLPTGDYFLSLNNDPQYQVVRILVPVKPNAIAKIHVNFEELKPIPLWQRQLFDHDRNYKMFGVLSGIFGLTTIGLWIYTKDLANQLNELDAKSQQNTRVYSDLTRKSSNTSIAYFTMFGLTILVAVLSIASRVAQVKQAEYTMGYGNNKNKLYQLEYVPINPSIKDKIDNIDRKKP